MCKKLIFLISFVLLLCMAGEALAVKAWWKGPDGQNRFWNNGNNWRTVLKKPGTYPPNAFGLNDMAGNVWEWCADWFAPYTSATVMNPAGAPSGAGRVVRGGGWNSNANLIRNSVRGPQDPNRKLPHTGFRIARDAR